MELTILIDGKPLDLASLRVKRDFHGAEVTTGYGDVPVTIDGKVYVLRIGEREWFKAEQLYGVKGLGDEMRAKIDESEETQAKFYQIALQRHQKDIPLETVADLMDWKEAGRPTLYDALQRCLHFSKPALWPDEEVDPKALLALIQAMTVKSQLESKTD